MDYAILNIISSYTDKESLCNLYDTFKDKCSKKVVMDSLKDLCKGKNSPIDIYKSDGTVYMFGDWTLMITNSTIELSIKHCTLKMIIDYTDHIIYIKNITILSDIYTDLIIEGLQILNCEIIQLVSKTWNIHVAKDVKINMPNMNNFLPFLQNSRPMRMACPIAPLKQLKLNNICELTTFHDKFIIFQR